MQRLVEEVGLTLYGIELEAKGDLIKRQGQLALRVSGSEQVLPLQPNAAVAQLARAFQEGQRQVTIRGTLPPSRRGTSPALVVERFALH